MKNLNDLFEHEIKDIYSAEKQLTEAFQTLIDESSDSKLNTMLIEYRKKTYSHFTSFKEITDELDINPSNTNCEAMEGLIKEWKNLLEHDLSPNVKDAGLIARVQRIMHYEISAYGTAVRYAKELGMETISSKLQKLLDDKYKIDTTLGKMAKERINEEAIA